MSHLLGYDTALYWSILVFTGSNPAPCAQVTSRAYLRVNSCTSVFPWSHPGFDWFLKRVSWGLFVLFVKPALNLG